MSVGVAVIAREIFAMPESKAYQAIEQCQETESHHHQADVEHELHGGAYPPDADDDAGYEDDEPKYHIGLTLTVGNFLIPGLDLGRSHICVFHNGLYLKRFQK